MFGISIQSVRQRHRYWHVLVFKTQVFRRLQTFARVQQRIEIVHDGVWKGSRFLFQINWLFMEIVLPTLDQFKPSFKNGLFSFQRSCILHFSCQFSFSFLAPRRVSPVLAWGDFHARSRFACSTTPEEKWETTRSLWFFASDQFLSLRWITLWTKVYFQAKTIH